MLFTLYVFPVETGTWLVNSTCVTNPEMTHYYRLAYRSTEGYRQNQQNSSLDAIKHKLVYIPECRMSHQKHENTELDSGSSMVQKPWTVYLPKCSYFIKLSMTSFHIIHISFNLDVCVRAEQPNRILKCTAAAFTSVWWSLIRKGVFVSDRGVATAGDTLWSLHQRQIY